MAKGAFSRLATCITCPVPPRYLPGPPESGRNSFFQNTSGAMVSVISTGTLRTPLGKAVALSPSSDGRAPVPPEWKPVASNAVYSGG
jgi:hypothetical protein